MKFTIHKNEINGMLKKLAAVTRGKPSSPRMAFIAVVANNERLQIVGASAGVGAAADTEKLDVLEDGACAVEFSVFQKFINAQKDGDLTIECKDPNEGRMTITGGRSSTSIHCSLLEASPVDDATPFLSRPGETEVRDPMVLAKELAAAMRGAWSAVNKTPTPEVPVQFLNVCFESEADGACRFVATDMRRLAITSIRPVGEYQAAWSQHVIPSEAFFSLMSILQQAKDSENVTLVFDDKRMLAVGDGWRFGFAFCANNFANYHPLLAMEGVDGEATIDRLRLETAIRRIVPVATVNPTEIAIDISSEGRCTVSASSVIGEGRDEFEFPAAGPVKDLRLFADGGMFLEGVAAVESDTVKLRYLDAASPLHMFFGDMFHYILMPLRPHE